jgi:hypothetical protein
MNKVTKDLTRHTISTLSNSVSEKQQQNKNNNNNNTAKYDYHDEVRYQLTSL